MGSFLGGFVLPVILLAASLRDWSLISLVNLLIFFAIQFTASRTGFCFWRLHISCFTVIFSLIAILAQVIFHVLWYIEGKGCTTVDAWWARLFGFVRVQPWESTSVFYFLSIQSAAALVAYFEIYGTNIIHCQVSSWDFSSAAEHIGSHLRIACCLLLPSIQLFVGISHPSWISLPFFIGSCVGLVDWSLTSNFHGLFRWWRSLQLYSCFSILMLYVYQLPIEYPKMILIIANFIGLYKMTVVSQWQEMCSGCSLLLFFFMLSSVRHDLEEMESIMSRQDNNIRERLLPSKHPFFIRESRSGVRHTNVLLRGPVFRNFSINFFTYGFPWWLWQVLLLALSLWSYTFASICAFGLLAYVGYVMYVFPSLFQLHRLNGLLLVFILLWAVSTYVFNVAFTFLNKKIGKDMDIWETIGLWHYPIPGFFLLAQFCLGVLVAIGNLVNNSVFSYLSDVDKQPLNNDHLVEDEEDTKVLIVATIAWVLRKSSRAITLSLIFLLAMKPGFFHAVYMIFFLLYLLSHSVSRQIRQSLILFCEAHFSLLYILQLNLVSNLLEHNSSLKMFFLMQIGLPTHASYWDFVEIGVLLCFCAVQDRGFKMLFSFSAIVQHIPYPPFGFSILKAGLNKSVLLSVYTSPSSSGGPSNSPHDKLIATYLSDVGQFFSNTYRSYGTYVAFLTILFTVYLVTPNYIAFGYLFLLLFWIIGRQLVEKTGRQLWFPLKAYAILVFIFIYSLSTSSSFQMFVSKMIDLYPDLGFNPEASLLANIWESLAILVVMQLYSYERGQSMYRRSSGDPGSSEIGILGLLRRFLIWHSEKILFATVFYASLSPISVLGFFYLLGLIICSTMPKASHIPSKLFLVYTGLLVAFEYVFQMWAKQTHILPGLRLYELSLFLGFKLFDSGFWGVELGLRRKVLVIIACTLQYNVFHWLRTMPSSLINKGKWEEPCQLFLSRQPALTSNSVCIGETNSPTDSSQRNTAAYSCSTFSSDAYKTRDSVPSMIGRPEKSTRKYFFEYIWGSSKENQKRDKKHIRALKKERLEIQKTTLKVYMKFWVENLFKLRGLEINMIALLLASFSVLNVISIFYIICLVTCILLKRQIICRLWPIFVFSFASILIIEYFFIWKNLNPWVHSLNEMKVQCQDCWSSSSLYINYCAKCWLGIIVDDPRMLISYYMVFLFSSLKLRADHLSGFLESPTYHRMMSHKKIAKVWRDLSFETKSLWTFLDYLRLYLYCHLLDIVLALILITGTLEYDILHLGYLCFALVFFRMRLEILKKKNKIFKFLRLYNFSLIVLSLAYQSPYLGDISSDKCDKINYIYEVIGLHKYDYGFRITSRSALVEIVIFLLASMQSYIFCSKEFEYVAKYLEAEQIGAIVHEQEKKAAWKTAQLQHIRKSEELKHQRNLQVEKMKSEVLNLQIQLNSMNPIADMSNIAPQSRGLRRIRSSSKSSDDNIRVPGDDDGFFGQQNWSISADMLSSFGFATQSSPNNNMISHLTSELHGSPRSQNGESSALEYMKQPVDSLCEMNETRGVNYTTYSNADRTASEKSKGKVNPLISAVQLIGDGVSQVQSFGNQAVTNIVSFLNIEDEDSVLDEHSCSEDGDYDKLKCHHSVGHGDFIPMYSENSGTGTLQPAASLQLGKIFRFIWAQMQSNNDVVCYCCFILVFLWNFSLLSMIYLAALFLYALCVSSGPGYLFWLIMLIYTEVNILIQYLYQIIIQHCGMSINLPVPQRFGFPSHKIMASFVMSFLPLFMVYVSTLLQSSITAKDGEWAPVTESKVVEGRNLYQDDFTPYSSQRKEGVQLLSHIMNDLKVLLRSVSRHWMSMTQGSEAPPYFVQLSMKVNEWPQDGIQPERIESRINQLLTIVHEERCAVKISGSCHSASRVRVQSIERSKENPDLALAVFEVIYASPVLGCPSVEWYRSLNPAADVAAEIRKAQSAGIFEDIRFPYPIISVIGGGKREIDLYAYVFCADLAVFFLVATFYQSVKKNSSNFLDVYQFEDQFPKEFVSILMVLFFLIVLDRIIYLCSFATGKVIFYLFNLVLFTYSVAQYAWYIKPSHQIGGLALRAIYFTKAVSLVLQALQIRYGIPNKSTLYRQFLTSKITQVNYLGFRLYRALPFLYELRCVLDWSCTSTSLTMYDWLKLEDINASLFLVKCDAGLNRATHHQGQKQTKTTKFCSGICLFFILICVIWTPMLIYSSGNPTNIANPIKDVSVQIELKAAGGRLTLFQTTLCEIFSWENVVFGTNPDPQGYLETYNVKDIQLVCCQADASTLWLIPSVVQNGFIKSLDIEMDIIFSWLFYRERPKGKEFVKYELPVEHPPNPAEVKEVLNGTANSFRIFDVYPRYFRVTGSGEVRLLEQTVDAVSGNLLLNHGNPPWWSFHDIHPLDVAGCKGLTGPMAIIVSEETPQGILGETISKFSIWSLYLTFVLAVGRFIRLQCSELRMRIPYENLPSCDRLIAICEDIYAARAEGELEVEEILYWTLVKIYRSPHMLLEYTNPD